MHLDLFLIYYPVFTSLGVFFFGACLGSFACLCMERLSNPRNRLSCIVFPGSHCDRCGHFLSLWENVPLLSYILLRGQCRVCKGHFGVRHLMIEIVFGFVTLACLWLFRSEWLIAAAGVVSVLCFVPSGVAFKRAQTDA